MALRHLLFLFPVTFLSLASGAQADGIRADNDAALPELLEPHVSSDRPTLGDYRWMRGGFPGADDHQIAVWNAAKNHGYQCYQRHLEAWRAKLREMGIDPIEQDSYSIIYDCSAFNTLPIPEGTSWEDFERNIEMAHPIVDGIVYASQFVLDSAKDEDLSLAGKLRSRFLADQIMRTALIASFRGTGPFAGIKGLRRQIASDMITQQMAKIDADNTAFLKALVASDGWPKSRVVGEEAAHDAWLLVQHADADPPLQLTALRQMETLLQTQNVSAKDYAYLYDRIMLKLVGRQRYATQFECKDGTRAPQPLEADIASADRYRAAAKIETVAENAARMERTYGACS